MKQEQQEIENALLAENQPADESAGDTYHDHHQDELFGDFAHANSPKGSNSQKARLWYHERSKQRPRGRSGRSRRGQPRSGGRRAPSRDPACPTPKSWRSSPSAQGRRQRQRHGNYSSPSYDRRSSEHFDRWSKNRRKAYREESRKSSPRPKENISDLMTKPVTRTVLEYSRPRIPWPHEEPQSQDSDQPIARSGASS